MYLTYITGQNQKIDEEGVPGGLFSVISGCAVFLNISFIFDIPDEEPEMPVNAP